MLSSNNRVPKSQLQVPTESPREKFINEMKEKFVDKYSYEFGNSYPCHRSACTVSSSCQKVPRYMGWRHDKLQLGCDNKKWIPGQINKTVRILMKHHLNPYPYDTINLTRINQKFEFKEIGEDEKSTLHVVKKNGEISIEMRPLKDRKLLKTDCDPYLNCSPLKFIIKKHPEDIKKHRARAILKARGFTRKCCCKNIKQCCCEKKCLLNEIKRISDELKLKKEMTYEDAFDSSDSEIDFEFTPPTALSLSADLSRNKPDVIHVGKLLLQKI